MKASTLAGIIILVTLTLFTNMFVLNKTCPPSALTTTTTIASFPPTNYRLSNGLSAKQWSAVQVENVKSVWKSAAKMSVDEASLMDLFDVYSLFPETYNCDRNFFGKIGLEKGDGGKWTCNELFKPKAGDCVVVSIGSNGQWDFEMSILQKTNFDCTVHTFDCTGKWEPPHPNIKFHPWCLGIDGLVKTKPMTSTEYITAIHKSWANMTQTLSITHVDYLKIDIEGYEWVAVPPIIENWEKVGAVRPNQVAVEIHLWPQVDNVPVGFQARTGSGGVDYLHPMVALFEGMYRVGYQSASFEYNTYSWPVGCCAEYLFIKSDAAVDRFKDAYVK